MGGKNPSTRRIPSIRELFIALNAAPDLSRAAICRLAEEPELLGMEEGKLDARELAQGLSLSPAQVRRARRTLREGRSLAAQELAGAARLGARILTRWDPDYPRLLLELPLPPPVLYVQGELPQGPAVAIVGSRRVDPYGREVAEYFARELAAAGVTVVSGFARGVDAAAHRGALEAAAGRTVAVLGCGLDVDYPRGHQRLRREMVARGGLVSEYPWGTWPRAMNFPIRNRIIAALAAATLVVRAAPRSGSLITARLALDLGRDVYAIPGRIFDELALGPNALIRDGALVALHPRDILEGLGMAGAKEAPTGPETPRAPVAAGPQGELLAALTPGEPATPEDLALRVGRPVEEVLGLLLELELGGWVRRYPGPVYGRRA